MKKILILFLILSFNINAQECAPFSIPPSYELSKNKSAAIGYVACLHATGIVAEVGYKNTFLGVLVMDNNHQNDTYSFLQYEYQKKDISFYGGPAYRINNNPSLLIGRLGTDIRLYKRMWSTFSILQINPQLNYFHTGLKIIL